MRALKTFLRVAVLALVGVVAGCQTSYFSGDVQKGLEQLSHAQHNVLFNPASPLPDASAEDIARGFLAAAASAVDDYEVAREYLATAFAHQWDPRAQVLIDDGRRTYSEVINSSSGNLDPSTDGTMRASMQITTLATVNANGFMLPTRQGTTTQLRFEFVRENGQWRISSAPHGIVLDRSTFTSTWEQHPLTFISNNSFPVREPRWFVRDTFQLDSVVRQLIAGPQEIFRQATRTMFPSETELLERVRVVGGEAIIEISDQPNPLSEADIQLLHKQLTATLSSFNQLASYRVITPTSVVASGVTTSTPATPQLNDVYALRTGTKRGLAQLRSGTEHPLSDLISELSPNALTLDSVRPLAAARTGQGVYLVNLDGAKLLDSRPGVLPPALDNWGYVWSLADATGSEIAVDNGTNNALRLRLATLDAKTIKSIRLSPDGTKVAFLVSLQNESLVYVTGVSRHENGRPLSIGDEAMLFAQTAGQALDFDWIDDVRIGVLSNPADDTEKITIAGLGSFTSERGSVPGAVSVSGISRATNMRVLTADNQVYRLHGAARWELVATEVTLIAKYN